MMSPVGHLYLEEICLAPSTEWEIPFAGWCFARLLQGQAYWLGPPSPQSLNAGDLLVLFPQRKGLVRASRLGETRLVYFRFCPELLIGFLTPSERHILDSLAEASSGARFFFADSPAALRLGEVASWAGGGSSLQLRCQLLQVIGLAFSKELTSTGSEETGGLFAGNRIRQLMARLTEAELLQASAPLLATRCGCSVRHFNRLFLQTFGESFRNKQTELRLSQAQRLLTETDLPVKEVARAAGFKHLGIFYARFKRLFAMTPVECRRRRPARQSVARRGEGAPSGRPSLGNATEAAG